MNIYETIKALVFNDSAQNYLGNVEEPSNINNINIFDDLGYESLSFVQLIIELEEAFDIVIPDDLILMNSFDTIGQIHDIISNLLKNKE